MHWEGAILVSLTSMACTLYSFIICTSLTRGSGAHTNEKMFQFLDYIARLSAKSVIFHKIGLAVFYAIGDRGRLSGPIGFKHGGADNQQSTNDGAHGRGFV